MGTKPVALITDLLYLKGYTATNLRTRTCRVLVGANISEHSHLQRLNRALPISSNFANMTISNTAGTLSIDRLDAQAITALEGEFSFLQLVNGGEIWQDLRFLSPYARKISRLRVSGVCDSFAGLEELTGSCPTEWCMKTAQSSAPRLEK